MSRKDKRKNQRKEKKSDNKKVEAMRWFHSLPPEKAELVNSFAKLIAEKHNRYFIGALEVSYAAAIIKELDLEGNEIQKIIDSFDDFVEDHVLKMRNLTENLGGDLDMAIKKVNEKENFVRERAMELLKEGKKQKEIREVLSTEFPMLSKAMITNAYKHVKNTIKEAAEMEKGIDRALEIKEVINKLGEPEIETRKALEYIFEEDKTEVAMDVETVVVPKIEIPVEKPTADFEILKEVRIIDLKGKYGKYHVEKNVVELVDLDLAFSSEKEVAKWAEDERDIIWDEIKRLQDEMNFITDREEETIKVIKTFI